MATITTTYKGGMLFESKVGKHTVMIDVKLPHADCQARKQALLRVAQHCPVHETIDTMEGVQMEVLDRSALALAL